MTWKKGQSGNPLGRASAAQMRRKVDLQSLAREHTKAALKALVSITKDDKAPHSARVQAATTLLERGYGKPQQDIKVKGSIEQHVIGLVTGLDALLSSPVVIDQPANGQDCLDAPALDPPADD